MESEVVRQVADMKGHDQLPTAANRTLPAEAPTDIPPAPGKFKVGDFVEFISGESPVLVVTRESFGQYQVGWFHRGAYHSTILPEEVLVPYDE
jgi:uncharacterized protein YodC (DUF2158 family)